VGLRLWRPRSAKLSRRAVGCRNLPPIRSPADRQKSPQSSNRMRRIGVLMGYAESDPEAKRFFAGFMQTLADLGWIDGRNLQMNVRWAPGSVDRMRSFAKELVELQPDVILANSTPVTAALQRETRTIPIVFAVASVGSGFVASLARPGGNITGFSIAEPSLPGKWMELLTEITPGLQRAAMMFNPDTAAYVSSAPDSLQPLFACDDCTFSSGRRCAFFLNAGEPGGFQRSGRFRGCGHRAGRNFHKEFEPPGA
jgi:ABC transporter substrate binding protein